MSDQETQRRQFGRYELINQIAVGGMGEIYLARSRGAHGFEKRLVIKKILPYLASEPEFVSKFVDEAKIVTELTHGNIVPVFDMGEIEGEYYIAMEFIAGRDLREVLKACRAQGWLMPAKAAMFIVAEVCKGLDYAHHKKDGDGRELNIIHRDVSPSNILISTEGEVKLVDFGIAKATNKTTRSVTNQLQGKFCYMSPEQAMGKNLDKRSDLFSAGVCLYELLTNVRPFEGRNDLDSLERVRNHHPPPPSALRPEVSVEVDAIVMRALAKDPTVRFKDSDEMSRAILTWLFANGGVASREVSTTLLDVFPDGLEREETRGTSTLTPVQRLSIDDLMRVELEKMLSGEELEAVQAEPSSRTPARPALSSSASSLPAAASRRDGKSETVSLIHPSAPTLGAVADQRVRIGEEGIAPDEIHKIERSVTAPLGAITAETRAALLGGLKTTRGDEPEIAETPRYGVETPVGLMVPEEEETAETAPDVGPEAEVKPKPPNPAPERQAPSRMDPEPVASPRLFERPLVRRVVPLVIGILLAGLAVIGYNTFFAPASLTVITVPSGASIAVEGQDRRYQGSGEKFTLNDLHKGEYAVQVSADHHEPEIRRVNLGAGEREVLQFVLDEVKTPAVVETRLVRFETTPPGADIWVGGTPAEKITPDKVEIPQKGVVVALVFKDQKKEFFIEASDTTEVYTHDFNKVAAVNPDAGVTDEGDAGGADEEASGKPEETGRGLLSLNSTPPGATVYVNKKLFSKTPVQKQVPVGMYSVGFELEGYNSFSRMVQVKRSGASVSATLTPDKPKDVPDKVSTEPAVSVRFTTATDAGPVYCKHYVIDGQAHTTTAMSLEVELIPGSHAVKVRCEGEGGALRGQKSVQVSRSGQTFTITVKPLNN